jgi:hypothetical protein
MTTAALLLLASLSQEPAPERRKVVFSVPKPTDVEVAIVDAQGKVVRHLAAGVLGGANPPPAPLAPGLSQALEWDGKDDLGRAARGGPFRARVRTGMKVSFGRTLADSPYNFNETLCRGLAVDANGDLYLLGLKSRDAVLYFLRVYDRRGEYLREILPYPAGLEAGARKPFGTVALPGGGVLPQNYFSLWPVFYPFSDFTRARAVKLLGLHPSDGSVVLLAENQQHLYRIRKGDGGAATPVFGTPLWDKGREPRCPAGLVMGAFGNGGRTLYLGGFAAVPPKGKKLDAAWPDGRVYQVDLDAGGARPLADLPLPETAPPPTQGWHYSGNVCALHGLWVEKGGRILACDAAGGKVWVIAPDGKVEDSVEAPGAYMASVDEATGALYVLTRRSAGYQAWKKSLLKLSGWKSGAKVVDALEFPEKGGASDPFMAVDFGARPVQIWVSGCPRAESVLRIEDAGKLKVLEDLSDRGRDASGYAVRMAVDPEADLVYVNNGWAEHLRYDGRTGAYAGERDARGAPKPIIGSELCVGHDGTIYRSGPRYSGTMSRLSRDLTPLPLPDGRAEFGYYYGRMGGGYFGNHGCSVDRAGRLLVCNMFNWCQYAVLEFGPDGKPVDGPRLKDVPWGDAENYKKAGVRGALIGWLPTRSGGLKAGPGGHVYVGVQVLPRDYRIPEGMDQIRGYAQMTGCVIKFKPSGGAVHPDDGTKGSWSNGPIKLAIPDPLGEGLPMGGLRTQHGVTLKQTFFEGAVRAYPGLAPFSGFDRSDGCVCQSPRFDVDDYGRVYMPNALTCSVTVVDDSGNEILRFGAYGNRDSEGPRSRVPTPEIPLAYPVAVGVSAKHLYVADSANRRVVRVDPVYASEKVYGLE